MVLEREPALAGGQTARNSGVVHAGIYYAPGSLKARLCVEGARLTAEFCAEHGVPFERCGKLIVARNAAEIPALDGLERRGRANGVPGLERLDATGIERVEPACRGAAALWSPGTAITDFSGVARAIGEELRSRGAVVATSAGVDGVETASRRLVLRHARGETSVRFAVFCAGGQSDALARLSGAPADPRIVPFRGAYLRLDPDKAAAVRGLVYPVPDPRLPFLGVHLTRHIGGEVSLGPTALPIPTPHAAAWLGTWRMFARQWRAGAAELRHAASRRALATTAAEYVPGLRAGDFEPWFAGIRAQAVARNGRLVDDFVLHSAERALHVRNAPSPAATSAFALAREIAEEAEAALA